MYSISLSDEHSPIKSSTSEISYNNYGNEYNSQEFTAELSPI